MPLRLPRPMLAVLVPLAGPLAGQGPDAPVRAAATVAVLNLRFDGSHANVLEPGDTLVAAAATSKLLATLARSAAITLIDSARVAQAVAAEAGGDACDAECARAAARRLGGRWVAMGTLAKTSNLVWILTVRLLDVPTGRPLLADGYELKGDARIMAPAGAHVFAQRVERVVAGRAAAAAP